jgi:peptidoglycan/LPS O-acetylase OafA/YrhL
MHKLTAQAFSESTLTNTTSVGRFYRPELDVLRFVAFLMVFICHSIAFDPELPHWLKALDDAAAFGVPVFFCLSAYLITELLTVEKSRTGTVNTKAFYVRRILRIWPLYFLMLGVGFTISRLHPGWAIPLRGLVAYLLLVGNWYSAQYGTLTSGIGHLWTIPVEEQFYLIWPMLVLFLTRRRLGIACVMAWVLSQFALIDLCHEHAVIGPRIWVNSLVHLQFFALGAGLSLFLKGSSPQIRSGTRLMMIFSAFLLFFVADFVFDPDQSAGVSSIRYTYPEFLLVGLATAVLLTGFLGFTALGGLPVLRYLGKISYGLYMYHYLCLLIIGTIVARVLPTWAPLAIALISFPLTIAIAALSYRHLETPFLQLKERFEIVRSRAV